MKHDVFISFSSDNTDIANKVVDVLEESGEIKCWIANRDIVPSANYAEQLVEAIESCKLLLLILSEKSNRSPQVAREIERAGSKGIPILPLRIEDVVLSKSMEYFISSHHWLDAYEGEIEKYFPALITAVKSSILGKESPPKGTDEGTRKLRRKTAKGIGPQKIFGGAVALTVIALIFFYFRSDRGTPNIETNSTAPTIAQQSQTPATPAASSQDALIQELAQRFKENRENPKAETDGWTTANPITIAFLDISATGMNNAELDFILNRTGEALRESKRYSIVEREMINKLLQELNLSSSDLADPSTALKLGRILSANLIVTGSLSRQDEQWLANLRFIETETTAIKCTVSTFVHDGSAETVANELGRSITGKLQGEYPLQSIISAVSGQQAIMNIGRHSGVSKGMMFDLLQGDGLPVGTVKVAEVEQEKSTVIPADNAGQIAEGMRLREQVGE